MPKRLLVLGAGGAFREGFFRAAARRGVQAILVDDNPYNRYDRLADATVLRAPDDPELPDVIEGIDGVTSLSDRAAGMVHRISRRFGLPGPGQRAADASHDKAALRRWTNGPLSAVPWARVVSAADLARFEATYAGPVVLKPVDGAGSFGVAWAPGPTAAADRLADVLARSRSGVAIVEAYLPGDEYSFEVSVQHGQMLWFSVTEKGSGPHFVERQHLVAPERRQHGVAGFLAGLLGALGVEDAVLHVEARHGPGGWCLVEAAVRPAGGMIAEVTRAATGIDIYHHQISIALGEPPPDPAAPACAVAGVRFVLGSGVTRDIGSLANLSRDLPAVSQLMPLLPVGHPVPRVDANWWRAGYVLAQGADRAEVVSQLLVAERRLTHALGLRDTTAAEDARSQPGPLDPADPGRVPLPDRSGG